MQASAEKWDTQEVDWDSFRRASLSPGGFGAERAAIWPQLLHVKLPLEPSPENHPTAHSDVKSTEAENAEPSSDSESHRDERQIGLDTERSFVFYPVGSLEKRQVLQGQLHDLIVAIFRKRRKLSYFQGYHDVITVLFLTLPREMQLPCVEKLSLHHVRDSMGSSLGPLLGLLRILNNLLRLANPTFASVLERNVPLPYYALSNLLTLFSHDMPTLPLIQHVFDYLLCRPPIAVVYLAAAIILSREQEVERLEEEGEEGMVHSLLSGLPELYDGDDMTEISLKEEFTKVKIEAEAEESKGQQHVGQARIEMEIDEVESISLANGPNNDKPAVPVVTVPTSITQSSAEPELKVELRKSDSSLPLTVSGDVFDDNFQETCPTKQVLEQPIPQCDSSFPSTGKEDETKPSIPPSPAPRTSPSRAKVSLSSLLLHADFLYSTYPPTHPSLSLSKIMGPNSVINTWSPTACLLPSDDDAESMVLTPELVVYPHVEEDLSGNEVNENAKRRYKRPENLRRFVRVVLERRMMMVGAVLVLGIAIAVYGTRTGRTTHGYGHGGARGWKRLGGQLGIVLVAASERILERFGLR